MKKSISKIMFLSILSFLFINNVKATGATISVYDNKIYVGDSTKVIVSVNSNTPLVSIEGTAKCTGSGNASINLKFDDSSNSIKNKKYTFSVKAKSTGTIKCSLVGARLTNMSSGSWQNLNGSVEIDVVKKTSSNNKPTTSNKTTTTKKDKKSSNNNLKELSVTDFEINPKFSKDKKEYSITVPNETSKIKINAKADDSKADVSGTGEKEVKEGSNKFEIVVKAENGSKKTYVINITVDSKPIIVKVDGNEYNLIKKKDEMPELDLEYEDMVLTIEEQEVPAYRVTSTDYILVALKDSEGNVSLYKFDSEKDDPSELIYTKYIELRTKQLIITPLKMDISKIPSNYKKYNEIINEQEIEVYKLNKKSNYSLIYGLNVETGKQNVYKYDNEENTLQIYEREEEKLLEEMNEKQKKLIIILGVVIVILILLVTIGFTRKK